MALDRTRCVPGRKLGTMPVVAATTFREGDVLHWTASGWVISNSKSATVARAIAGCNKATSVIGTVVDEVVVFTGTAVPATAEVKTLAHANLTSSAVAELGVRGVVSTTLYVLTTHYTCSTTNGTLTNVVAPNTITEACYVSYSYTKTMAELETEVGLPIDNSLDETLGSGNATVLDGKCRIVTDRFVPGLVYSVLTTANYVYDNGDGRLTSSNAGGAIHLGKVVQVPTAADPYLTVDLDLDFIA